MKEYTIYAYKKKENNQVVYVGQTTYLEKRHYEHIQKDPFCINSKEYNYPLSRGVRKYGEDYYQLEILEENVSEDKVDDREKYWIAFYDTYWNGYNQTKGGRVFGRREIIHDDVVDKIIDLLKNSSLTFEQIKNITGVSLTHIYNINIGVRRKDCRESYPIRTSYRKGSKGILFSREEVTQIHLDLKNTKQSMNQLAKKYNCTSSTISNINKGIKKCYHLDNWDYPIRETSQYSRDNSPFKKLRK